MDTAIETHEVAPPPPSFTSILRARPLVLWPVALWLLTLIMGGLLLRHSLDQSLLHSAVVSIVCCTALPFITVAYYRELQSEIGATRTRLMYPDGKQ